MEKCIACGLCAEKCPKKVTSEYDMGLVKRKAAYVSYEQAVPLKYAIDPDECIYLTKGKCRACEKFCPTGAVNFQDKKKERKLQVGSVVLAIGGKTFDPAVYDTYGYTKSPDIVTSLEFERILSASGPSGGHLLRPSDKREPGKIAWLQCVGSRDSHLNARGYCSSVCCTYAIKEAILAKEHVKGLDAAIFYIDIRVQGKGFERFFRHALDDLGVRFIKSKITNILHDRKTGGHLIRYVDTAGRLVQEDFDMVVLSVGLEPTEISTELAKKLDIELDHYNYVSTSSFEPVHTSRPGIFVCGAFQTPKDIPLSVIGSSAAAGVAGSRLSESRWSLTRTRHLREEKDVRGETPRIGVFVCCCGTNIAAVVDVPAVVEFARRLPGVVHTEQNMFSCSQDSQEKIARTIEEHHLNRVVVAACTPKTHEPLFQETLINAGINKYLFEMANIRNQCSWVHKDDPELATEKAKDLVRMAVAKVGLMEPLPEPTLEMNQNALVIGGGIAGMSAAKNLAEQGHHTLLIEKGEVLGGQARFVDEDWRGEKVHEYLNHLIEEVKSNERIEVLLNSQITKVEGFVGNFRTSLEFEKGLKELEHGITIIASGASELKPDMHLYGRDRRVMTNLELMQRFIKGDPALKDLKSAVFILCVGSRIPERPYCSKICCTNSIKSALKLKDINPEMNLYIVYQHIRAYGLREDLYREARSKGIVFIRYDVNKKLSVNNSTGALDVQFTDFALRRRMRIKTDLLLLATAIVTEKDNPLSRFYKVPQNDDGFFMEAHVKLRPVDSATDGVFLCGLAHYPKTIADSITQAQAAAARAVTLLSAKTIAVSGTVAMVNPDFCSSCGICVSVCPYSAPRFDEKTGRAQIEPTLCKGCGLCVASCRSGAIWLRGFETSQIMSMINQA